MLNEKFQWHNPVGVTDYNIEVCTPLLCEINETSVALVRIRPLRETTVSNLNKNMNKKKQIAR